MTTEKIQNEFGRVSEDGTVYVLDGGKERAVGQYPDSTPQEALAFYERRYEDLLGQVNLLQTRIARGVAGTQAFTAAEKLVEQTAEPAAVGDLEALRERAAKLLENAKKFTSEQQEKREAAKAEAYTQREAIVQEAEELVNIPEEQIRWKETGLKFEELFQRWQDHQRNSTHLPKSQADLLWKRFRTARQAFETGRRKHFAAIDARNKTVKVEKEALIEKAQALTAKGAEAVTAYRQLLDQWKKTGRASRKIDDALWARFKAAGDVIYSARAEQQAVVDEEFAANLAAKEELLEQAQAIRELKDHKAARKQLTALQLKWDEIGRVPRENVRNVESRMRDIEDYVKELEETHWRATDPEPEARSQGLRNQLETSIAQIEAEIASATGGRKTALEEKLKTQKAWLAAIS